MTVSLSGSMASPDYEAEWRPACGGDQLVPRLGGEWGPDSVLDQGSEQVLGRVLEPEWGLTGLKH